MHSVLLKQRRDDAELRNYDRKFKGRDDNSWGSLNLLDGDYDEKDDDSWDWKEAQWTDADWTTWAWIEALVAENQSDWYSPTHTKRLNS